MTPDISSGALVINLWGLQAAANGTLAIVALSLIVLALILARRSR